MSSAEKIAVTGATGALGRLVVAELQRIAPQAHVIAVVRDPEKAKDLAAGGVEVRVANYDDAAAVKAALAGVDKVLLISGNEVGRRVPQHANVVEAAKAAGVKLLAYTSILHGEANPNPVGAEHAATEKLVRGSGVPFVILRNGWYTENYTRNIPTALQTGAVIGASGDGRISAAARADYALAAAAALTSPDQAGKVYELAGDESFTQAEFAAELARQSGKPVVFRNLPEAEYAKALAGAGVPEPVAALFAKSDATIAQGSLYDDGRQLSSLIGGPTTPLSAVIAEALRG